MRLISSSATALAATRPRRRRLSALLCAGAAFALPAPSAQAAPSVTLDGACFTPGMAHTVSGTGFTPSGQIRFELSIPASGESFEFVTSADATGAVTAVLTTPPFNAITSEAAITVQDLTLQSGGAAVDQFSRRLDFELSQWLIAVDKWSSSGIARAKPGRRTSVLAIGWVGTQSTTLYAHYLKRKRLVKTVRVGRLTGPCGDLETRMVEFPFKARTGSYKVQFDTTRTYPNDDYSLRYPEVVVTRRSARASLFDDVAGPFDGNAGLGAAGRFRHQWQQPAGPRAARWIPLR